MSQARIAILLLSLVTVWGQSHAIQLLRIETAIPMADLRGRIDHLSVDLKNQRLFVAALGNNTVEVLYIKDAKRLHFRVSRKAPAQASLCRSWGAYAWGLRKQGSGSAAIRVYRASQ